MFSKTLAVILLAVASVNAHAIFTPPLGVSGTPARSDVQRPSTAKPCGTVNIASTIDSTTPIVANADGTFTTTVTDFNAGADGSRSAKSARVDATGVGKTFVAATITKNGNAKPSTVGSDQVTVQLPAGTKCTGGQAGNLCLVSMTTTAGFGSCVVVQQGGAAANNAAANGTAAAATTSSTAAAASGKQRKTKSGSGSAAAKAGAAARAARSLETVESPMKRAISRFFLKEMA